MAGERLEAKTPVERDGKTYWTKCGVAFPTRDGGYSIQLDAVPVNGKLVLMKPREYDDAPQATRGGGKPAPADDDMPF